MLTIRSFGFPSIEAAFNSFQNYIPTRATNWSCESYSPEVDIRESENAYTIEIDLPGLTEKDIQITLENRQLSLKGERKSNSDDHYERRERGFGAFERVFGLPDDVDLTKIEAKSQHGVLRITLHKAESAKPKTIAVVSE